ncbi:hypothetical protein Tco_0055494, partial [Tanacetum coccineum]
LSIAAFSYDVSLTRFRENENTIPIVTPPKMCVEDWSEWVEYRAILDLHVNGYKTTFVLQVSSNSRCLKVVEITPGVSNLYCNEGFAHIPKFRSTVFFDGVTYTSSKTFQQLKIAEMDASRIAYFAIKQKSKLKQ